MQDLLVIHKLVTESVENNEITLEEAELLYDKMYKEQVESLILDVYEAFENGDICADETNAYITLLTEAVKGPKLSACKGKACDTAGAIADKLKSLPETERKAIEDSIKRVSKVANHTVGSSVKIANAINEVIKSKKKDAINAVGKVAKAAKAKVTKESVDDFDLDAELALFESTDANKRYLEALKKVTNEYRDNVKEIRKNIRAKDAEKAKKNLASARKDLSDIEREIAKVESDTSDDVMAAIGNTLKQGLIATAIFGVADAGFTGININDGTIKAGAIVGLINTAIRAVRINDSDKGFNVYKDRLLDAIKKEKSTLDRLETAINKLD